jgi:hypothetical protein
VASQIAHHANAGEPDGVVIISDDFTEMNQPIWSVDDSYDDVQPAQFQGRSRANSRPSQSSTTQARLSGSRQRAVQTSQLRLANTPKMMGDFFGLPLSDSKIEAFVGRSVHHTTSINDFHLIDETGTRVLYVGGPGGGIPGSFFVPGPTPPPPSRVEGLKSNVSGDFVAVQTSDVVAVFNSPSDTSPDLPNATVFNIFQVLSSTEIPIAGPGDIVGRVRLQENNSAMPQDRVFFDYNFFHNVPLTSAGLNVHRFTPGVEKTFLDGQGSVEFRVPMGISINSDVLSDAPVDTSHGEMGNVVVAPKLLLFADGSNAFALGCGVALPTADDLNISTSNGTRLLTIENEAVHLLPYVAYLYSPTRSNLFAHAFVSLDVDTNGNATSADVAGTGFQEIGVWNDQNLISGHLALGSWFYQNYSPAARFNGFAGTWEMHYTNTLNEGDSIAGSTFTVGDPDADLSLLNTTIGGHARWGLTTLTLGYCTPLTEDKVFDGELRCFVNRNF